MPSVGRKPTPKALNELRGNPGKRKQKKELEVPPGLITCPMELSAEAQKEWDRIAPTLESMGVLSKIDTTALAAYCESWARWVDAEQKIRKFGPVMKAGRGFLTQSPYLKIANQALDQMRKFMVEFGLTPSSRSRVKGAEPKKPDDDEWGRLENSRPVN